MEMKNVINLKGKHLHKQLPLSLPALEEKILVNILSPPLNELPFLLVKRGRRIKLFLLSLSKSCGRK